MGRILRQTTVCRDGMHNAFTDMRYWQGALWITYRKGSGHVSTDASAIVAVSDDRARFQEVAKLKMPGDVRDPKFFPVSADKMALFFPSWHGGYEKLELRQYITFSEDGFNWEPPRRILGENQWLWRIREHDGIYYALVQDLPRKNGGIWHNLDLMTSTDLMHWETIARVGSDEEGLNESDIIWRPDGEAWIVARARYQEPNYSYFATAKPPYTEWTTRRLEQMIHAPVFLERGDDLFVAGRCDLRLEKLASSFWNHFSVGVWQVTRDNVERVLHVPAYGDCSYPGLIQHPDGTILMSYYSQHAYLLGVEPVAFRHDVTNEDGRAILYTPNDVYLAELELKPRSRQVWDKDQP